MPFRFPTAPQSDMKSFELENFSINPESLKKLFEIDYEKLLALKKRISAGRRALFYFYYDLIRMENGYSFSYAIDCSNIFSFLFDRHAQWEPIYQHFTGKFIILKSTAIELLRHVFSVSETVPSELCEIIQKIKVELSNKFIGRKLHFRGVPKSPFKSLSENDLQKALLKLYNFITEKTCGLKEIFGLDEIPLDYDVKSVANQMLDRERIFEDINNQRDSDSYATVYAINEYFRQNKIKQYVNFLTDSILVYNVFDKIPWREDPFQDFFSKEISLVRPPVYLIFWTIFSLGARQKKVNDEGAFVKDKAKKLANLLGSLEDEIQNLPEVSKAYMAISENHGQAKKDLLRGLSFRVNVDFMDSYNQISNFYQENLVEFLSFSPKLLNEDRFLPLVDIVSFIKDLLEKIKSALLKHCPKEEIVDLVKTERNGLLEYSFRNTAGELELFAQQNNFIGNYEFKWICQPKPYDLMRHIFRFYSNMKGVQTEHFSSLGKVQSYIEENGLDVCIVEFFADDGTVQKIAKGDVRDFREAFDEKYLGKPIKKISCRTEFWDLEYEIRKNESEKTWATAKSFLNFYSPIIHLVETTSLIPISEANIRRLVSDGIRDHSAWKDFLGCLVDYYFLLEGLGPKLENVRFTDEMGEVLANEFKSEVGKCGDVSRADELLNCGLETINGFSGKNVFEILNKAIYEYYQVLTSYRNPKMRIRASMAPDDFRITSVIIDLLGMYALIKVVYPISVPTSIIVGCLHENHKRGIQRAYEIVRKNWEEFSKKYLE
ncbi:MAG: hypothetical protein HQM10_10120 [Candidatus Riflebacteria bacterium]|nr:hypothetical protein [Candidatus Riflebacteria bacterium]